MYGTIFHLQVCVFACICCHAYSGVLGNLLGQQQTGWTLLQPTSKLRSSTSSLPPFVAHVVTSWLSLSSSSPARLMITTSVPLLITDIMSRQVGASFFCLSAAYHISHLPPDMLYIPFFCLLSSPSPSPTFLLKIWSVSRFLEELGSCLQPSVTRRGALCSRHVWCTSLLPSCA